MFSFISKYGLIGIMNAKKRLTQLAEKSGVTINGDQPWDIQVNDESVYNRVFASGRLAFGESFMDKQWDCDDLVGALSRLMISGASQELRSLSTVWLALKARLFNLQSSSRAYQVGEEHYDYGNDMYETMLGKTMVYTSGIHPTPSPDSLDQAQVDKMDAVCQKLGVKPGDRLLDIGCGWGALMKYAAKHYGAECVGLSVSEEQTKWARASFGDLPCQIVVTDYRDYVDTEGFDHVVSIEMFEHVGPKNHRVFFKKVHELLRPGGKQFMQVIVNRDPAPKADPWLDKYIFPNGILPSPEQLHDAARNLFHWDAIEDIGTHYDHTLMGWWNNLEAGYEQLHSQNPDKYNERFLRMMKYYLHSCAALFRTRMCYDWQIVWTKM